MVCVLCNIRLCPRFICIHIYTYSPHTYSIYIYTYTYLRAVYLYIYRNRCAFMYIYTHTYIYIYICMYTCVLFTQVCKCKSVNAHSIAGVAACSTRYRQETGAVTGDWNNLVHNKEGPPDFKQEEMGAVEVQGGRPELENHPRFIFKGESNSGRPLFEVWPPSGKPSRKGVQSGLKLLLVYTWFFVTSIFVFRVSCSGKTFLLNISMRNTPSNGQPLKGNTLPRFS